MLVDFLRWVPRSWTLLGIPGRPIPCLRKWIEQARLKDQDRWRTTKGPLYEVIHDRVIVNRDAPRTFEAGPHPREFAVDRHSLLPPFFLATLLDAHVLGPDGVVITADGRIVAESTWPRCHLPGRRAWNVLATPPIESIQGRAYVIASPHPVGYYHWLFDVLPRLMGLERFPIDDPLIIVNDPLTAWQDDSLALLGIPETRRLPLGRRHIKPDLVLLPSFPGDPGPHPEACRWLRQRFLKGRRPVSTGRRLYVTRRLAKFRRVSNESAIEGVLKEFGFEFVEAERLNFAEQLHLFSEANIVAGPHGAGMANVVFAPEDCRVVELFQPSYVLLSTYKIATALGQHYWYLITDRDNRNLEDGDNGADMRLDPTRLWKCLDIVVNHA